MAIGEFLGRNLLAGLAFAASFVLAGPGGLPAAVAGPVVVELFTSQGCSSCPPADANLGRLSAREDVLALSFGVAYWDYLGWQDTFARREFSARQQAYARAFKASTVYTPQMVINGRQALVGNDLDEIDATIDALGPTEAATVSLAPDKVVIAAGQAAAAEVWLVRYEPGTIEVPVARGENGGRTLSISHVVRELTRLGDWTGPQTELPVPAGDPALKRAILVQDPNSGAILAAASE
jgi:hypothetical protein